MSNSIVVLLVMFALFPEISSAGAGPKPSREPLPPIGGFDVNHYLGKWYEIARITKSFERDCRCVTAEYSLRADGNIDVKNTCYKGEKLESNVAHGLAKFATSDPTVGDLKVSFFLPWLPIAYGNYRIVELIDGGRISLVTNKKGTTFWILSREPGVSRADAVALSARIQPHLGDGLKIDYGIQDGCPNLK